MQKVHTSGQNNSYRYIMMKRLCLSLFIKMKKCEVKKCHKNVFIMENIEKDKLKYCQFHKCEYNWCCKIKMNEADFCNDHKCVVSGCENKVFVYGYCYKCFDYSVKYK